MYFRFMQTVAGEVIMMLGNGCVL